MTQIDEAGMRAAAEMPRYTSHKTVHALEISAVGDALADGGRSIAFVEKFLGKTLPAAMFSRYVPVPGDFYVVYADGYESFSPRKAFLEGYKPDGQSFREIKDEINGAPV